jgi:hypothetical protein
MPRAALEQLHAELAFKLVDRSRDRGLRAEQRGASEVGAALFGDGEEDAQVAQLGLHDGTALLGANAGSLNKPAGRFPAPISVFDNSRMHCSRRRGGKPQDNGNLVHAAPNHPKGRFAQAARIPSNLHGKLQERTQ